MADLLYYDKETTPEGDTIEKKVWKVNKSKDFPQGIKYALVYIHKNKRIIGYDNERSKGHHKHYLNKEETYMFTNLENLFRAFDIEIINLRELLYGKKEN